MLLLNIWNTILEVTSFIKSVVSSLDNLSSIANELAVPSSISLVSALRNLPSAISLNSLS